MKRLMRIFLSFLLALSFISGSANTVHADDEDEYTYTIFIYAGKEGNFPGGKVIRQDGYKYGDIVTIDVNSLGVSLVTIDENTGNYKYYVRGLSLAGHDNDEVSHNADASTGSKSIQYQSYTFRVEGDMSFSVAYGVAGGMVKYTVNYVSEDGTTLYPSQEYYGMPGDYPVVSYQYVESYVPNAYNLGKTLTANEEDNVFTFTYRRIAALAPGETVDEGTYYIPGETPAAATAGAGTTAAAGTDTTAPAAAPAAADTDTAAETGPAEFIDLDENQVPQANAPGNNDSQQNADNSQNSTENIEENASPLSSFMKNPVAVGIAAACAGALLAIILLFALRKKDDEESEE